MTWSVATPMCVAPSSIIFTIVLRTPATAPKGGSGLTREVRRRYPEVAVVILTGYADEAYVAGALAAGAAGYILKGSDVSELEIAIHAAARTEAYVTPRIARQVISEHFGGTSNSTASAHSHLTSRQRQTLQLIAAGQTNKEIAEFLNISVKTVEKHRAELMQRLGLHNVAQVVRYAL